MDDYMAISLASIYYGIIAYLIGGYCLLENEEKPRGRRLIGYLFYPLGAGCYWLFIAYTMDTFANQQIQSPQTAAYGIVLLFNTYVHAVLGILGAMASLHFYKYKLSICISVLWNLSMVIIPSGLIFIQMLK